MFIAKLDNIVNPMLSWGLLKNRLTGYDKENRKTAMGYCGNVCDYCPRYIASQSGDKDKLTKVAILWHKAGALPKILPPEEIVLPPFCRRV